ncbi:MAG: hypothetical protein NT018_08950 [Armatimonadetes bacterium]|nr:hypothetical protein [Armatimonadota bacterium]
MDLKTLFVIAITTAKMIMPGMPDMSKIPGMNMPDMGAPNRTMTMNLTSGKPADANSKAECAVPEGLRIGPKAILDIDLPQKSETGPEGNTPDQGPKKTPELTIKMYWKSSKTVLEGQPKIIDSKSMSADMQKAMAKNQEMNKNFKRALAEANEGSHAYWPGQKAKPLAKDSTCPGDYTLTTNYCGGTSITFDKPQDFLAAFDLSSPGKDIDLAKYIKVEWKPVPNAAAYMLSAMAMKDNLIVMWTSASDPEPPMDILTRAISKEELQKYIEDGKLLSPDQTICYIPEGIFKELGSPMLTVNAIGTDKTQTKDGIETQVIVRSNATVMMGMMGMGGEEEAPPVDEDKPEEKPAATDKDKPAADSGDTLDKTDNTLDKVNKVGDILRKGKDIFKR